MPRKIVHTCHGPGGHRRACKEIDEVDGLFVKAREEEKIRTNPAASH
ncbi:MAG TPA: hypothetical protein VK187_07050 [Geobacteraceae bacterium]|nr:hypothetical protein [Geobacteraceae bacterium]